MENRFDFQLWDIMLLVSTKNETELLTSCTQLQPNTIELPYERQK